MHSVGIDLHRKRSHIAVIDEEGEQLLSRRIINDPQTFLALLEGVGECRVALEATYGWEWLADVLQDAGYDLHLAHPMRKGDRVGAGEDRRRRRAHAGAAVARRPFARGLHRAARAARPARSAAPPRRADPDALGAEEPRLGGPGQERPYSDLFGPGGLRFLAELELRDGPRRRLDSTLALIADFSREIDATSREIDARAHDDPYVPVLCQIRGVGRYIAMLVIAEVGDITRFATARRLCSWAGLTPTVRSSDGKARLGHIPGQGSPPLRWALVEAAQHAAGGSGPLRQSYEQIAKRRGKQIAKVAIARRILTLCFYGLRDGEIRCLAPRATARAIRTPAANACPPRPSCAATPGRSDSSSEARPLSIASDPPPGGERRPPT